MNQGIVHTIERERTGLQIIKHIIVTMENGARVSVSIRDDSGDYKIQPGDSVRWDAQNVYWNRAGHLKVVKEIVIRRHNMAQVRSTKVVMAI